MATAKTKTTAPAAAKKAAPAPAPAAAPAPQQTTYVYTGFLPAVGKPGSTGYHAAIGWPAKAAAGNTIRAYCAQVAQALTTAQPGGFTKAQLASAFAANAAASNMRQPGTGWGTPAKPNGVALQHANWFSHANQMWLVTPATLAAYNKAAAAAKAS